MKIKAAVCWSLGGNLSLEDVELAEPKEREVLIRMVGSGICHTDAVAIDQDLPTPLPAVMGHEGSGIVEKVGSGVNTIKPGDRVVLSYPYCGECEACVIGHPSQCQHGFEMCFLGVYQDGTKRLTKDGVPISSFFNQSSFATYAVTGINNVVKVNDDELDLAMLSPLGCGLMTGAGTVMNKLKPEAGSSIAIFGCGAVGLAALMAAKIVGCSTIIGIDIVPGRLALATELGATHVIDGSKVDAVEEIIRVTGKGADYSLDTTAAPKCINQALYCLKPLGTAACVGSTGSAEIPIRMQDALMGVGKTLLGCVMGDAIPQLFIPKLIKFHKEGKFPFQKLIKFYRFEEINQAFTDSKNGTTIKPVIRF